MYILILLLDTDFKIHVNAYYLILITNILFI